MKKKSKIISLILVLIFTFTIFLNSNCVMADINIGDYEPGPLNPVDYSLVNNIVKPIIDTIATIGILLSVIILILIGIKYMTCAVEQKAEYKKKIIPYLIGVFMICGITQFLRILANLVSGIKIN